MVKSFSSEPYKGFLFGLVNENLPLNGLNKFPESLNTLLGGIFKCAKLRELIFDCSSLLLTEFSHLSTFIKDFHFYKTSVIFCMILFFF